MRSLRLLSETKRVWDWGNAYLRRHRQALFPLGCGLVVAILLLTVAAAPATTPPPTDARTLWDWLQLLLVPAALIIAALIIATLLGRHYREIAAENRLSAALQDYLLRMSDLIAEHAAQESAPDHPLRRIARARTAVALRQLDSTRRQHVLDFLRETRLLPGAKSTPLTIETAINLAGVQLANIDLAGNDLRAIDLSGAGLEAADLREAQLDNAQLQQSMLRGANLDNAALKKANLQQARLWSASLYRAYLERANLRETVLMHADLQEAFLDSADLRGALLAYAELQGAILANTDLRHANLSHANLQDVTLTHANMQHTFLRGAYLQGANLQDAIVTRARLAQAVSLQETILPSGYRNQGHKLDIQATPWPNWHNDDDNDEIDQARAVQPEAHPEPSPRAADSAPPVAPAPPERVLKLKRPVHK